MITFGVVCGALAVAIFLIGYFMGYVRGATVELKRQEEWIADHLTTLTRIQDALAAAQSAQRWADFQYPAKEETLTVAGRPIV